MAAVAQAETDDQGRGEQWWRQRADSIRMKIRSEEGNKERYQAQLKTCQDSRGSQVFGYCEKRYDDDIKRSEQRLEQLNGSLDALADEARRAGALPAWIRD